MDSIWSMLDVVFVGAGVYVLYALILMKTSGEIKTSVLMNKDVDLKKCKDLEGYKRFIAPRMLVFGVCALIYGVCGLVNTYAFSLPDVVYGVIMALFLVVLIWFAVQTRKGVQNFW